LRFEEIGWNGFLIRVPEEMHLTRQGGDANKGTFIIESEDSFIEFYWNPIPKRQMPLLSIVDQITDRIEREAKKKRLKFTTERSDTIINDHKAIYLLLNYGVEERYYVWQCPESNRVIAVRLIFKTYGEKERNIVKQLMGTIKCHMDGDNVWSLMKIRFEAPKSFLLRSAEFSVGRSHIELAESKISMLEDFGRMIYVCYFPLANVRFKDTYNDPEKWFDNVYLRDFRRILRKRRVNFEFKDKVEIMGHEAIIKQAEMTSGLFTRTSGLCSAAFWYCPETNRMYFVALNTHISKPVILKRRIERTEHERLFGRILESFHCH